MLVVDHGQIVTFPAFSADLNAHTFVVLGLAGVDHIIFTLDSSKK